MKRKLLSILLAASLCATPILIATSCGDDNNVETPDTPDDPGNPDDPDNPVNPDNPSTPVSQDVPTPVEFYVNKVEATADGVSIEVTDVTTDNFKFVLKPGANCRSYRADVYPLCRLYNSMLNDLTTAGGDKATAAQMDAWVRSYVFNSQSMGQYIFSAETLDDYEDHEVDWVNSSYANFPVVSDCEYVIVAVGCFDADGAEQGDLSICYVKTEANTLQGSPAVDFEVSTSYTGFSVKHLPNADCKYIYYWCSDESDLMPYINGYGDKLYIDFLRHTIESPVSVDDASSMYYEKNFGQYADPTVPIMATAVALDANGTPSPEFQSVVFQLKERPTDVAEAECSITVDESRVGAGIAYFSATMEANCRAMLYHLYKKDLADSYRNADQETQDAVAWVIDQYGWGISNANYAFDSTTGTITGGSFTKQDFVMQYQTSSTSFALEDGEEYVFVYVGRNPYNSLSRLYFSEPFHVKERVEDQPEAADNSLNITVTGVGRTSAVLNFSYDPDKLGLYYHQYVYPYEEGAYVPPQPGDSRERWLDFFLRDVDPSYGNPYVNCWWPEAAGSESYTLTGLTPGTHYIYAYCEEDMNGYMGEVKWVEFDTVPLSGGENPTVEVVASKKDAGFSVTFKIKEDVLKLKYMCGGEDNSNLLLNQLTTSRYDYNDIITAWKLECMEIGMDTFNDATIGWEDSSTAVALCVPIGQDADGNEVIGDLYHVLWVDGELKVLDDYKTPRSAAAVPAPLKTVEKPGRISRPAAELQLEPAAAPAQPVVKTVWADAQQLAKHPSSIL